MKAEWNALEYLYTMECSSSNKSATGIKWFREDHLGRINLMESKTSRKISIKIDLSYDRNIFSCEIQGERRSTGITVRGEQYFLVVNLMLKTC